MTEKKSEWGDISFRIIIAAFVPITVAIIGIYGNMIVSQAGANQRALERLVRQAEAETSFRRDMFAELFNDYVDQISVIEIPRQLDALATRLELLSSNFSDFLALRPLYLQLDRQINHLLPFNSPDENVLTLRHSYQKRLEFATQSIIDAQAAQISQRGVTRIVAVPTDYFDRPDKVYRWPEDSFSQSTIDDAELQKEWFRDTSSFVLDGVVRSVNLRISNMDKKKRQVRVELSAQRMDSEGLNPDYLRPTNQADFKLDYFSFPLESNMILSHNHRLALSLQYFDERVMKIRVQLFHHIAGNLKMGQYLEVANILRDK